MAQAKAPNPARRIEENRILFAIMIHPVGMDWMSSAGRKIVLEEGDITRVAADAIVNAANSALAGGGGVDGAIHRAGGPEIMRELDGIRRQIGRCPTGSAVATIAGRLPAQCVFHAVGPVRSEEHTSEL